MNALATKRAVDMPMLATIARQPKGPYSVSKYIVTIKFTKSRRIYSEEIVFAANMKLARTHILKMYPTVKWKKK